MSTEPPVPVHSPKYLVEYSGHTLIFISALFITLESIFIALRYYARTLSTPIKGWDDLIIPVAWLANIGLCILGISQYHHSARRQPSYLIIAMVNDAGVGHHLAAVLLHNSTDLVSWAKSLYALEWLYLTAVALPKISVLCLYLRLFTNRTARLTCYILIGVIIANWIAFLLASTFQCSPVVYQWDKSVADGKCFNVGALYKASSAPNIATDVVILILPIPTVWLLKASRIRKLGLMLVFLTGSVLVAILLSKKVEECI